MNFFSQKLSKYLYISEINEVEEVRDKLSFFTFLFTVFMVRSQPLFFSEINFFSAEFMTHPKLICIYYDKFDSIMYGSQHWSATNSFMNTNNIWSILILMNCLELFSSLFIHSYESEYEMYFEFSSVLDFSTKLSDCNQRFM